MVLILRNIDQGYLNLPKFKGVQWTFYSVLYPFLINLTTLFLKATELEFSDNYSQLLQSFSYVWIG